MTDFIEIIDNALDPAFCRQLIDTFDQSRHRVAGRTGGGLDSEKKISEDLYLNRHPEYVAQLKKIQQVTYRHVVEYCKKYRFMLIAPVGMTVRHPQTGEAINLTHENFDEVAAGNEGAYLQYLYRIGDIQAQKYVAGKRNYNYWHCENYPSPQGAEPLHRTLLFMFYLNDVTEGGETDFYYQSKSIQPKKGRMVIAPAYFTHTHRGRVPISNDKYILTSWVLFNPASRIYQTA